MGTSLHLLLSHWQNKRNSARNTMLERSRGKEGSTETEGGNKTETKRDRRTEISKESFCCSYQVQVYIHLTCFTLYYLFLPFFSSLLLFESEIISTWDLPYLSFPDVQYSQIRKQGMMAASSSVLRGREWGEVLKLHHWLAGQVLQFPQWLLLFQNKLVQTVSIVSLGEGWFTGSVNLAPLSVDLLIFYTHSAIFLHKST